METGFNMSGSISSAPGADQGSLAHVHTFITAPAHSCDKHRFSCERTFL